ncbi:ODHCY, partial [Symbiodinium necroappetens]
LTEAMLVFQFLLVNAFPVLLASLVNESCPDQLAALQVTASQQNQAHHGKAHREKSHHKTVHNKKTAGRSRSTDGRHPPDGSDKHCRPQDASGRVLGLQRRIRKEVHTLSDAEFQSFAKAANLLKEVESKCSGKALCAEDYPNTWDSFRAFNMRCHNDEEDFLVCHRRMLYDLETSLQKISGDCDVTLPYWNPYREPGNALDSKVWNSSRFGALWGVEEKYCYDSAEDAWTDCVTDGVGADWKQGTDIHSYDCSACLNRAPELHANLLPFPVLLAATKKDRTLEDFQSWVRGIVADVHFMVGGDMAHLPEATTDPVSFAHLGMVDLLLSLRQVYRSNAGKDQLCTTCSKPTAFYNVPRSEWLGKVDAANSCIQVPASSPRACIGYGDLVQAAGNQGKASLLGEAESEESSAGAKCSKMLTTMKSSSCGVKDLLHNVVLTQRYNSTSAYAACRTYWSSMDSEMGRNFMQWSKYTATKRIESCKAAVNETMKLVSFFRHAEPVGSPETKYGIKCDATLQC